MDKLPNSKILFGACALVGVYFLAQAALKLTDLWTLIFGAVVVAVILRALADPLMRRLKLGNGLAVLVSILIVLIGLGAAGFLFGAQISEQVQILLVRLPSAWAQLQAQLAAMPGASELLETAKSLGSSAARAFTIVPKIALGVMSGITTLVLVVVAGVFLAIHPVKAREGVLSMAPKDRRARLREVLNACGGALRGWLKAQCISMILVGSLVGLGLWVIGVPAPIALGLLTGLAQFVPIVGPIVSAVPALIVAMTGGPQMALLTFGLYVGVSQLEANLITPLVQRNLAALPVVLGIFGVVGLGALFGPLGVLFATPLTLVIYTVVTMLYRQDVLDDRAASVPGAPPARPGAAKAKPGPPRRRKPAAPRPAS